MSKTSSHLPLTKKLQDYDMRITMGLTKILFNYTKFNQNLVKLPPSQTTQSHKKKIEPMPLISFLPHHVVSYKDN